MFVYTVTKKRAFRMALIILAVFVGIAIGVASILTAINTNAAESKIPIYSVDRGDNKISITFDCAWGNSNTDSLLEILKKYDVRATFFVTGEFCDKFPDDVRKMFDAGHEIANHSDKHPHIKNMNVNDFIQDTKDCSAKIKKITGVEPTLYRSPYGEYDDNAITTIEGMKYKFIQWSVDSIDWQEPDAAVITKRILGGTVSGSILLFHNDLKNTEEALPVILPKLKQSGFEFITVGDLIYKDNYYLDNSGKQIKNAPTFSETSMEENTLLNEVIVIVKANLTFEEIASMKDGLSPEIALKIAPLLTAEQFEAITEISENDYAFAWSTLMTAVTLDEAEVTVEKQTADSTEQISSAETSEENFDDSSTDDNPNLYVKGVNEELPQTTIEEIVK